jgi:hypothetical protein
VRFCLASPYTFLYATLEPTPILPAVIFIGKPFSSINEIDLLSSSVIPKLYFDIIFAFLPLMPLISSNVEI